MALAAGRHAVHDLSAGSHTDGETRMVQTQQPAAAERRSLWRERDFSILFGGALISEMGDSITSLALPLTAVLVLHVGAFQLGALRAADTAAFLLIALPAGVLVDRRRKRPVMLAADLGRMLLIGSIPVTAALGILTLGQLYLVALGAGCSGGGAALAPRSTRCSLPDFRCSSC